VAIQSYFRIASGKEVDDVQQTGKKQITLEYQAVQHPLVSKQ
jgi:hypothetical protein